MGIFIDGSRARAQYCLNRNTSVKAGFVGTTIRLARSMVRDC